MLEKVGEKIVKVGQGAVNGTKKIVEIKTLSGKIQDEKRVLNGYYAETGKRYYQFLKDGSQEIEISQLIDAITVEKKRIEDLSHRLQELKGNRLCAACGEKIPLDTAYCSFCGEKQPPIEEPEENQCRNCGAELKEEDVFCSRCGARRS